MPIYLYWGEDDFALTQAVTSLKAETLDSDWTSFNFDRIAADQADGPIEALNQAMTPPFGTGQRFVWLQDPPLLQSCPETLLTELERRLPQIPDTSVLLLTSRNKPNARLKITKLLQEYATVKEFSPLSPWDNKGIEARIRQAIQAKGLKLTRASGEFLIEAIGNNIRQLEQDLEKLKLYAGDRPDPLDLAIVSDLITPTTQTSLQLAQAIRQGDAGKALDLIAELLNHNEPALRIVATLVGQFRTWLWVKLVLQEGGDDGAIATAAGLSPKRVYFIKQEVRSISLTQLLQALPILLELDLALKQGQEELATLQTKALELCQICAIRA